MSTYVVKLGGNALDASSDQEALLATLADDIGSVREQGHFVVVVHGGGPQITAVATAWGAPTAFVEGLRVTDATMLEAVVMGLSLVNVELCRRLARGSVRPVGLHGASSGLVRASMVGPTWGRAGHRPTVEPTVLTVFDALGFTPVVAPLALDENGGLLNCNADAVAGAVAAALGAELIVLSDIDQLRRDVNDPTSAVSTVSRSEINQLLETKAIVGGMIPKVAAALAALDGGAGSVRLANGTRPHALMQTLNGSQPTTEITP